MEGVRSWQPISRWGMRISSERTTCWRELDKGGFKCVLKPGKDMRPVTGCPGYFVIADGEMWSSRRGKWVRLKPSRKHNGGYEIYKLAMGYGNRCKCRTVYLHRSILEEYVGPCPEGMEACHNDGDPTNNCLENLRWDTHRNNGFDSYKHGKHPDRRGSLHPQSKLTESDLPKARKLREQGLSYAKIGKVFGVHGQTMMLALKGLQWKHAAVIS